MQKPIEKNHPQSILTTIIMLQLVAVFAISCTSQNNKNSVLKQNQSPVNPSYQLSVEKVTVYDENDLTRENYLIGRVDDIAIDGNNNVYICDAINITVKKFSPTGKFIQDYGDGEGEGPGQFMDPRRICFDDFGNLAILDYKLRRITCFKTDGEYLNTIPINTLSRPAEFFIANSSFFITGFGMYQTPPVQKIDMKTGELLSTFGMRSADSVIVSKIGNSMLLIKDDRNENIFLADYYPYKIYHYLLENNGLLNSFSRKASFLRPPVKRKSPRTGNEIWWGQAGIRNIALLFDKYLFVKVEEYPTFDELEKGARSIHHIDVFDVSGAWLLTIPVKKYFGYEKIRNLKIDQDGYIYLSTSDPFPHVAKFKISLKDVAGNDIIKQTPRGE